MIRTMTQTSVLGLPVDEVESYNEDCDPRSPVRRGIAGDVWSKTPCEDLTVAITQGMGP